MLYTVERTGISKVNRIRTETGESNLPLFFRKEGRLDVYKQKFGKHSFFGGKYCLT
jgi:hypothetical protein